MLTLCQWVRPLIGASGTVPLLHALSEREDEALLAGIVDEVVDAVSAAG